MFLSDHDFAVVLLVVRGRRRASALVVRAASSARRVGALVAGAARGRPPRSARAARFDVAAAAGPAELQRARPTSWRRTSERLAESRDREAPARGVPPRAGLVGLARPAHAAGRAAGDDRGARGRPGRGPGALPPADARRGRPDGADGRRPLRALPDPRRRAPAHACRPSRSATWSARRSPAPTRWPGPGGVRLGGAGRATGVLVRADPAGLSRVVANLVMNAIRHTPADGVGRDHAAGRVARRRRAVSVTRRLRRASRARTWTGSSTWPGGAARPARRTPDVAAGAGRRPRAGDRQGHRRGAPRPASRSRTRRPGCRFLVRLPA